MKKKVLFLIVLLLGLSAFACAVSEALIELTENTRIIEAEAFYGIPSIKRVVLPEGVREIGARAFAQSGLVEINLPDSLVFIDDTAFEGCGPLVVTANKGSAAYEWAVQHGYIPRATASTSIDLCVGETYTLDLESLLFGAKVTYSSSDAGVASVSGKGVVTAQARGYAVISCHSSNALLISFLVHVCEAPDTVRFEAASMNLGVGEAVKLHPVIPAFSRASFSWTSADKKIAAVDENGVVEGKKAGETSVTVTAQNGRSATLSLKVLPPPEAIVLDHSFAALLVNDRLRISATLPGETASQISWSSSDENVAVVDDGGTVRGVGAGTATITARTFNGKSAACEVSVSFPPVAGDDTVAYRALLIGQETFTRETCRRNREDVTLMEGMLKSVRGLYGGDFSIEKRYDLDAPGVLNAIQSAFAGADSNDVSLFFIATHGDTSSTGENAGRLTMSPEGHLTMGELARALGNVPGRIIVILGSCGSGSAVYDEQSARDLEAAAKADNQAAVRAFSKANAEEKERVSPKTSEMRVWDKFYVLTASAYHEDSYGWEESYGEAYNYFTRWLTEGVGTSGRMPADGDGDGLLTLKELHAYISDVGDYTNLGFNLHQHVQAYPENSGFVLFRR